MLDLTGLPALDLAIGLAFIFFLLATLALTIQEFIAAILGLRARTLEQGLRSMLEDPNAGWRVRRRVLRPRADQVALPHAAAGRGRRRRGAEGAPPKAGEQRRSAGPRGRGTDVGEERDWHERNTQRTIQRALGFFKRTKGPSYISPRSFALVVLDNFAPENRPEDLLRPGDGRPSTSCPGPPAATKAADRRRAEGRREAADQPRSVGTTTRWPACRAGTSARRRSSCS